MIVIRPSGIVKMAFAGTGSHRESFQKFFSSRSKNLFADIFLPISVPGSFENSCGLKSSNTRDLAKDGPVKDVLLLTSTSYLRIP